MTGRSGADEAGRTLRDRLDRSFLYLVTPEVIQTGDLDRFLAQVLEAGVDMVQLRCKQMEAGPLLRYCAVVRRRTTEAGALFIVNDRVDVAIAAGADGVHLGQDDLPVAQARRQIGPGAIIGVSTHSREQLLAALDGDADYAAVGPVFATPTKPGRPATGLDLVSFAADRASKPVFAIGGIDPTNIAAVVEAGAARVSVVRALTASHDPAAATRALNAALRAAPEGSAP